MISQGVSPHEAHNKAQDTLANLWIHKNPKITHLPYVLSVAKNTHINSLRSEKKFVDLTSANLKLKSFNTRPTEEAASHNDLVDHVKILISRLSQNRQAIIIGKANDVPAKFIATKLNTSVNTVNKEYRLTLKSLKKKIK